MTLSESRNPEASGRGTDKSVRKVFYLVLTFLKPNFLRLRGFARNHQNHHFYLSQRRGADKSARKVHFARIDFITLDFGLYD